MAWQLRNASFTPTRAAGLLSLRGTGPAQQNWGNSLTTTINHPPRARAAGKQRRGVGWERGGENLPRSLVGERGRGRGHLRLDVCTSCSGPGESQSMGGNKTPCFKRAGVWGVVCLFYDKVTTGVLF